MLERSYEKLKELTRAQDSKRDRGLRGSTLGFSESCFWSQSTCGACCITFRFYLFLLCDDANHGKHVSQMELHIQEY